MARYKLFAAITFLIIKENVVFWNINTRRTWINTSAFLNVLSNLIFHLYAFKLHIDRWPINGSSRKIRSTGGLWDCIGKELAYCSHVIPNPEELKDKEWIGAYCNWEMVRQSEKKGSHALEIRSQQC